MTRLTNRTWDALEVGQEARLQRLARADDFIVFAHASGNHNPMHLPRPEQDGAELGEPVAPAMWVASLVSALLGNVLPGPGALYRSQSFRFLDRAHAGETLEAGVRVTGKGPDRLARFTVWVDAKDGRRLLEGEAEITAPAETISFDDSALPGLTVQRHAHFDAMLRRAEALDPIPTAVVAPHSPDALEGALLGARHTLIAPILVGERARIAAAAETAGVVIDGLDIVEAAGDGEAAAIAVALVRGGRARALMKGHLHTDDLLRAVLAREGGLRTRRRLSHVFVMDVPGFSHPLLITDAAINIAPDLQAKADIAQNAIDLARAVGVEEPRVGVLSAVETVNPAIPSSTDAAILSKMAERGQIRGGAVDGPLAMDNAIDLAAARTKGLTGRVAGRAEVLVAPDIEAGNTLAKALTFLAHAEAGGVALGAACPIILTSRADDEKARLASCAVAALHADWLKAGAP